MDADHLAIVGEGHAARLLEIEQDEPVSLDELTCAIGSAKDEDAIFDLLESYVPPDDPLVRQQYRGRLADALKPRFKEWGSSTSATRTADAWLTTPATAADLQGEGFTFEAVDPWGDPVQGEALIAAVMSAVRAYSYAREEAYVAMGLWTILSHCFERFGVSPILQLHSPTKRCGKTSTIIPIAAMAAKPLMAGNITPSSLFRGVDAWKPTLIVDEGDTFMKMSDELRGMLNAGHTRSTAFVVRTEGETREPRMFRTFCPKVLAAIGRMPDTIEDRSIRIPMERKPTSIPKADAFDEEAVRTVCAPIRRQIVRWVQDYLGEIVAASPSRPLGLNDRQWNNWRPLLQVAEALGIDASNAARSLCEAAAEDEDLGTLLLEHIRRVFTEAGDPEYLPTSDILEALVEFDGGPWGKWWSSDSDGKWRGAASRMARMLKPFGIESEKRRLPSAAPVSVYRRADFGAAWGSYLEPCPEVGTDATDGTSQVSATSSVPTVPSVPSSEEPVRERALSLLEDPPAVPLPELVRIVREIVDAHAGNCFAAAFELNETGIPTPNGEDVWTAVLVDRVLKAEA
jgi:putative DNA primase/helicase